MLNSLGHTEFEPLDNLALYGWRRFQSDRDASGLHCTASCPAGICTGVACANSSQFVETVGGTPTCVAQCSSANPVAVGRECRSACPPSLVASATTPSFCETEPHCGTLSGTREANGVCDEHCPTGFKFIEDRVCTAQCTKPFYNPGGQFSTCADACDKDHSFVLAKRPSGAEGVLRLLHFAGALHDRYRRMLHEMPGRLCHGVGALQCPVSLGCDRIKHHAISAQ